MSLSQRGRLATLFLFLILLVPAVPVRADDVLAPAALKAMSVEELMAIQVVTVSRKPENWSEVAGNLFVLTGATWQGTGPDRLPDLLRLAPNLFVAQASASQWAVNARGFVRSNSASNKLLVMVDGRSVYSPLFSNVFWDTTNIFLPDLQQIEIISGPAGASWGSNAVNGAINIQTKSALDTLGTVAYANAGNQTTNGGFRVGWQLSENSALRVYLQSTSAEASRTATGAEDDKDGWRATQGGFRGDWKNGTDALTLSGDMYREFQHNGTSPEAINDGYNLLARWARDLSSGANIWVRMYYDQTRRNTRVDLIDTTRTADLELQHALKLDNGQELMWGGDARLISDRVAQAQTFAILPHQLDSFLGSLFVQHRMGFLRNTLRLTTGLRLEHNHYSGWEYQPSIRLAWLRPGQTVWISASRATRIPSRLDADFYLPAQPPYVVNGGPDVRAETVKAYEIGWRLQPTDDLSFTITGYDNDYDHLRSLELTYPLVIANGVAGRSYGVEFFADWGATSWWRVRLGGFRMNQETWLKPGGADLEKGMGESSFPKYQLQLRNSFHFGEKVVLWTALRRVAAVPTYDGGAMGFVPAYTELDVNLDWTLRPGFDLSVTGRNLLHPAHAEIGAPTSRRQIPRSIEGGVKLRF